MSAAGRFASKHPRLYHMAEAGSHESILRHGLLSTTALLDLFEVSGKERYRIESCRRPEMVEIHHPEHGTALIRDNKPINEKSLQKSLTDMTMRQWYETLNSRVFFWVDERRLENLLNARAYRGRDHLILQIDTAKLLERHCDDITLSTINSGATFALGAPLRGSQTFRPLNEYPLEKPVVELTVDYAVRDVEEMISATNLRTRG